MTTFNFQFQRLLELKENEKSIAQSQMAHAIRQQETGKRHQEAIHSKIQDAERLKKEKQQGGVHISELRSLVNYIQQLQEQLVSYNRELDRLDHDVSTKQHQLNRKAQEEKTWEHMKQQKKALFEEQRKAEEQNFFDELASTRFYRSSRAGSGE
ncbi:flagellar export protein FliJ [Planococcus lenghuensis]|uniref:Flagellar FliJ protein n=1 Tax=Planococcus lenghuensis TaxID=2213202 RepID=A0A1Q2L115_9BACL|nr:flagellar export protein FliJ [Planococcus lenghuensis]AQQ54129.1 flagellar export protein FliJ [Planococcus lenghuensis]